MYLSLQIYIIPANSTKVNRRYDFQQTTIVMNSGTKQVLVKQSTRLQSEWYPGLNLPRGNFIGLHIYVCIHMYI